MFILAMNKEAIIKLLEAEHAAVSDTKERISSL
jgi:hypothetical protein